MVRTFVDSGVLIFATRSGSNHGELASKLLADPNRLFLSSAYVQLEVEPKAEYFLRVEELEIYRAFFETVIGWASPSSNLIDSASEIAKRNGLSAMDALHVAAAIALDADEFLTSEKQNSPLFRVRGVKMISLFA